MSDEAWVVFTFGVAVVLILLFGREDDRGDRA